jgi:hypothetical protein
MYTSTFDDAPGATTLALAAAALCPRPPGAPPPPMPCTAGRYTGGGADPPPPPPPPPVVAVVGGWMQTATALSPFIICVCVVALAVVAEAEEEFEGLPTVSEGSLWHVGLARIRVYTLSTLRRISAYSPLCLLPRRRSPFVSPRREAQSASCRGVVGVLVAFGKKRVCGRESSEDLLNRPRVFLESEATRSEL